MTFSKDDEEGRESYEGEWANDKPEGQGTMKWKNGDIYEGEYKEGERNGHGVATYAKDDESGREYYDGEWKGNQRDGQGTMKWTDGTVYEGEWAEGSLNGHGVLTYAEDDEYGRISYEGEFKNSKRDGQGTLKWTSGAIYEGEWKEDSRNGQGTHTDADGNVKTGIWNGDEYLGTAFGAPEDYTAVINPDNPAGVKLEWAAVYGATGYQTYIFKDAEHKEMWVDGGIDKGTNITWGSLTDGSTYYFGVRAIKEENGSTTYSDWSYVTYTHNP